MTFNFRTPEKNAKEADYPAALYQVGNVNWWLEAGVTGNKILLHILTFGHTWKLTTESKISGVPPIETDGAGESGPYTKTDGIMSLAEVCTAINPPTKSNTHTLRQVTDPSNTLGSYAYCLPHSDTGEGGIWVGYEDPDTAAYKASYAKTKSVGGIAMWDLSLDDFR